MALESEASLPAAGDGFFGELDVSDDRVSPWKRRHDWHHYVAGYKDAADTLTTHLETNPRASQKLGPPIVFLYRHHLELALKQLALRWRTGQRAAQPPEHRRQARTPTGSDLASASSPEHDEHIALEDQWPGAKGLEPQSPGAEYQRDSKLLAVSRR